MPSQDDYYYEPGEEYFPEGMYKEALEWQKGRTGESRNRGREDARYDRAMKENGPMFEELHENTLNMFKKMGIDFKPSLRDYVLDALDEASAGLPEEDRGKFTDQGIGDFTKSTIESLREGQANWLSLAGEAMGEANMPMFSPDEPMSPPPPAPPRESDPYRPDYTFNPATGEHVTRNPRRTYAEPNYDYRKPMKPDISRMPGFGTFPMGRGLLEEK